MTPRTDTDVTYLDILDPAFRVDSAEVRAAADANWYARTPIGIAVLSYPECQALLRDRRLRQGAMHMLTGAGVSSGLFADWLRASLLNLEGQPHQRQRRLVGKAFTQRSVDALRPFMQAKAHELIDSFAGNGGCEFMPLDARPRRGVRAALRRRAGALRRSANSVLPGCGRDDRAVRAAGLPRGGHPPGPSVGACRYCFRKCSTM